MDTKTPPIPLKHQEKRQLIKRQENTADLSLPPLAQQTNTGRHRPNVDKKNSGPQWTNGTPYVNKGSEYQSKRPYRVLHIGATPLMHACQQGDRSRVLRLLKEQEETINYRDRTLRNALHYCMDASTGGAVASAAPELVNASDAEGHTPLHLAVIAGDTQLVAVLLANGADVNARDLEGHSVLHWATVCGEAECVRLVLAAGAKASTPDLRGGSPLHYAAQCCGAAVTAELSVPKKVGLKVLHTLLEFGADVNAKDEDGRQPILWAASAGSVEAVLALARAGGSAAAGATDKDGLTALHCAASRGHARCVEALVNLCGSQPDHVDDNGCSALHYAATLGHADATALLLRLGADPNRQDRKGRTPALCAAAKGQLETLKILAQHGGSLHARTVRGTGVAHEAVLSGRIELIEWLARRKPSTLDIATHDGRTPLHVAALHGYLDTCKVLLDYGARNNAIFRTSKSGPMTPLDAALYRGHRDCAKLIQMHGGTTAQHIRTRRTAPNKIFAAKVKIKHGGASSLSDSESGHPSHQEADIYIEERWIEKRTRKHSTPRKRQERRGSRSFSEEEIRLSKTSRRDRRRRAKSESARFEQIEVDNNKLSKRQYSKHEYSESSSEFDESSDGAGLEARAHHCRRSESPEDDRSLSDDSLEVVVVRKSVEKKSEKVQYSDRKKKPKETSKQTRITETERRSSSRKKSKIDKTKSNYGEERRKKGSGSGSEETRAPTPKNRGGEKKFDKDMTDSTSQETVERVTVTAMVHKDQAPDTPTPATAMKLKKEEKLEEETLAMKSKMDHILEKADEMQSVLVATAADLKKDTENICRQVKEEVPLGAGDEENDGHNTDDNDAGVTDDNNDNDDGDDDDNDSEVLEEVAGRKEETNDIESNLDDFQHEFSKLQSQQEEERSKESASSRQDGDNQSEQVEENSREESKGQEAIDNEGKHKTDETESQEEKAVVLSNEQQSIRKKSVDSKRSSPIKDSKSEKDSQSPDLKSSKGKSQCATPVTPEKKKESDHEEEDNDEAVVAGDKSSEENSELLKEIKTCEKIEDKTDKEKIQETEKTANPGVSSTKIRKTHSSRPSTAKSKNSERSPKSPTKANSLESPEERSPDRSAIVAVIESPEWDEEDEEVAKEIQKVVGDITEVDTEPEDDDDGDDDDDDDDENENDLGILRVLPSTSEEETPRRLTKVLRAPKFDMLPRVERKAIPSPRGLNVRTKLRKDSGGRDSGIEPSPRVSKIPKRALKCCPNTEKQQALNMETIQRDVQISLRRYHLERKIFFQLMELKRLQIRHGKVNEHILVKRQVETFHKSGMAGPVLGVAKYDQPLTFRHFEAFLYEQLRRLQRRSASPDWCTEAKQCTQKTHRCHHATSAYTSVPVYTYLDGGGQEREEGTLLPRIENRGRGQMTVEVTKGEEKQVIALPAEKLDRTKRYFITFTVRGEAQNSEILNTPCNAQRNTKSV